MKEWVTSCVIQVVGNRKRADCGVVDQRTAPSSTPDEVRNLTRVIIYDSDQLEGLSIARRLNNALVNVAITVISAHQIPLPTTNHDFEIGLINAASARLDGLAFGAEIQERCPWIEIAFWFDESDPGPAVAAARSLGVTRLIPLASLTSWLQTSLGSLVRMAHARREYVLAARSLPPSPSCGEGYGRMALPEAERRFRETYVRRILSESTNHRAAAEKAGLPYTTFCSMLKKLNLR